MKTLLAAAACLTLGPLVFGHCVTVTPSVPLAFQVSPNIVITASLDGKGARAARIEVLTAINEPRFSLVADERGVTALPVLPPGSYHIVAVTLAQPHEELYLAELAFDVSQNLVNGASFLTMDLISANRFWPMDLPVDESSAPRGKPLAIGAVQRFQGSVIDPAGSIIAGAAIRVFREESSGHVLVTEIRVDESGHFSGPLGPGVYTASVKMLGFRTRMIIFEIAPHVEAKDLEISLNVGGC
jgi:hypothetical protein